ncbi:succinylglutamate desuccinylase/aspartoacylase family protein [Microbulbifer guangxiensis]|uniref:succinylglutamate desuccinylase/aspartoacylase family protein n=1 Tax=Microbulbifer guangxiensis TaxID=2904249 RepID=UPI001F024B68|nr:succinylglutamate desuccinylase/aspartoacylase family protein [Microbulbifer guangxiensis]
MQLRSRMSPIVLAQALAAALSLTAGPAWSTEEADNPEGNEVQSELPKAQEQPSEQEQPLEKAESISLDQPIESPAQEPAPEDPTAATSEEIAPAEAAGAKPLRLLGAEVPPATSTRLAWSPSQHFEGVYSSTAVLVVNGAEPGPTLCLTAAVHGDELNGIETVRRVLYNLDPNTLKGAVIGVPIVNLQGFHRGSRYLTDRRDLNRHFPGDPNGSSASRIAHSFFHEIIVHCNAVVDLHTGSFYRTNLPQLRGDLTNPKVVKLTKGFGSTVVLHSDGAKGTLRRAAVNAGIPTVTLEAGAPMVLDETSVSHSVKGIRTLLHQLDMVAKFRLWGDPEPVYYNSTWQRATTGGMIFSKVKLGQFVRKGDLLGTVTNPITNVRTEIRSEHNGRILGMALNQVVQPGFAAYHIGIQAPQEQISAPEEVTAELSPEAESDRASDAAGKEQPGDAVSEDGEPLEDESATETPTSEAMPTDAGDEPEEHADPDTEDK